MRWRRRRTWVVKHDSQISVVANVNYRLISTLAASTESRYLWQFLQLLGTSAAHVQKEMMGSSSKRRIPTLENRIK